jgi:hypothetical protein
MSGGKGGGKGAGSQVTGYKYYFGIHMGIGRGPIDELCEIKIGDRVAWAGSENASRSFTISQPDLFGGEKKEGGIEGTLDLLMGAPGQEAFGGVRKLYGAGVPLTITVSGVPNPGNGTYLRNYSNGSFNYQLVVGTATSTIFSNTDGKWVINIGNTHTLRSVDTPAVPENAGGWVSVTYTQGGFNQETDRYDLIESTTPVVGVNLSANYAGVPGFRRMVTAFFDGVISMNNPYPKPWKFRLRRILKGWDGDVWEPGIARIVIGDIHAMNPVHIIYECLTNREWGRGFPRSLIDDGSFKAAALVLSTEGFGLCIRWNRTDSIKAFIGNILDHMGGVLFTSRSSGLLKINLIRGDYVFDDLRHFTTDNGLLEIKEGAIAAIGATVNQIRLTYNDPKSGEQQTVTVNNLAAMQASKGQVNTISKEYRGIPTADLATRVAQRDLRAMSVNMRRFTLVLDRRGRALEVGGVFLISDESRGIPLTPVRIATIDDTSLTDGRITLTVAQDVFELPRVPWGVPVPNQWQPPKNEACLDTHRVFEVPYFMLASNLSRADLAFVEDNDGYIGTACARGSSLNAGYRIAVRTSHSTPEDTPTSDEYFCGYTPPT